MKFNPLSTIPKETKKPFLVYFIAGGRTPAVITYHSDDDCYRYNSGNRATTAGFIGWLPLPIIDPPMWHDNITEKVRCFVWDQNRESFVMDYIYDYIVGVEDPFSGSCVRWENAVPATLENAKDFLK